MSAMADALWSLYRNQKAKGLRAAMRQTLQKLERAGFTDAAWYDAMGELALDEGNGNLAQRFFQQACQKSDSAEYRLHLGHAHYALGDFSEAEKHYRHVLDRNGEDVHGLVNRANCLIRLQRLDEAWALCEQGLTKPLARPAFWNTQGQIAFLRGDHAEALRLFARAYQEAPDYVDALFNQANAEARLGHRDRAIEHFDLCTRKDENYESAFYNLAMLHLEAGHLREAQVAAQKALLLNAQSPDNLYLLGRIQDAAGEIKLARESFRKALRLRDDHVPSLLGLARVHAQESQDDEAMALLKRILGASSLTDDDRRATLSLLLELGHYALVLAHCERLGEIEAVDYGLLHTVALWKTGRIREAIARMEKVLLLQGESAAALTLLGMMLREHGAPQLAETRLRRSLDLDPNEPRAAVELARVLLAQDRPLEATDTLQAVLKPHPHHPDLLYHLAAAQSRLGNRDDALQTLHLALESGFSDWDRLAHDSDLQSLRQLKAFATLVGEPG